MVVDLRRTIRLTLRVPADVDENVIAQVGEDYFDGMTRYDGENDGDLALRDLETVATEVRVAIALPAERVGRGTANAARADWKSIRADAAKEAA